MKSPGVQLCRGEQPGLYTLSRGDPCWVTKLKARVWLLFG